MQEFFIVVCSNAMWPAADQPRLPAAQNFHLKFRLIDFVGLIGIHHFVRLSAADISTAMPRLIGGCNMHVNNHLRCFRAFFDQGQNFVAPKFCPSFGLKFCPPVKHYVRCENRQRNNLPAILERTRWKIKGADGAAELLGVKPTTLKARIKKMALKRPGQR